MNGSGGHALYIKEAQLLDYNTDSANPIITNIGDKGIEKIDRTRSDRQIAWFNKNLEPGTDLSKIKLKMKWKDQGWGNEKGRMYARLIIHDWTDVAGLAPHSLTRC